MPITQLLHSNWKFRESSARRLLSAKVPGCVHLDLLAHKLIPDPFWGDNEQKLQWISNRDWVYRLEFKVDQKILNQEYVDLVADGLDTLATIRVNDHEIARTDNMFIAYRFPVKKVLRPGKNVLEITFSNPMDYIRARQKPTDFREENDPVGGSSHIRKCGASFGWDWGPRLASCGIYKSIRLEAWSIDRLKSVRVRQDFRKGAVDLIFQPSFAKSGKGQLCGTISINNKVVAEVKNNQASIKNPQLWWPNGYGKQPLYTIKLEYILDGKILDQWSQRLGIRSIRLDRHKDQWGESFQFEINGRPIFSKGTNWIPAHSFVTIPNRNFYDGLLTSAAEAHNNMIRVWGGGIYEMDAFYDLCDEKGLLVWQDFMFACAHYPGTAAFKKSVKAEAEYQVTRLANRTCLALWCGNNEIEMKPEEILKTTGRKKAYDAIFYKLLPEAVEQHDGVTTYWPCSPHNPAGYEKGHNSEQAGDAHFWDVWHDRYPVKRYEETNFRFCSEFGMQSFSSPEIAATFCPPEQFNIFAPAMENHQKNDAGNLIILDYISRRYRMAKDYASLAYLSQLNQAYCMKVGVEHFRRGIPRTMGALYWQLNDCWPVASWSSLEFGGKWKAAHYASKRFFAPVLVSAHVPGDEIIDKGNLVRSSVREVHLHTISDVTKRLKGCLTWQICHLDGKTLESGKKNISLRYLEARRQKTLDCQKLLQKYGPRNLYLRICLETEDGQISEDTVFFTAPRFIEFSDTPIKLTIKPHKQSDFELTLTSKSFHHQVQIDLPEIAHRLSDNFFDLYPGEARHIQLNTSSITNLQEIKKLITTRSLVDSY
ncbi:MAG: beta-mannosidase [Chthoniobacterales bacterium]